MNLRKHNKPFIAILLLLTLALISCSVLVPAGEEIGKITDRISTPTPSPTPVPDLEPAETNALEMIEQGFSSVYDQVLPSVVNIRVEQIIPQGTLPGAGQFPFLFPFPIDGKELLIGGDIIVELDHQPITSMADLQKAMDAYQPGDVVTFRILRDGDPVEVEVRLGKAP